MDAFTIGNYIVEKMNDSRTLVHFTLPNGRKVSRFVPLMNLLENHLREQTNELRYIIYRFNTQTLDDLSNDFEMMRIFNNIPQDKIKDYPDDYYSNRQSVDDYNNRLIVQSYNQIYSTDFSYEEVLY